VVERDPITTAKEVASVDHLSDGRVLFGIGGGWNLEEMENHGTKPSLRWKIMRERVLAMKAIWTQDDAEYHGEHVDFDPIWAWPKPVQKPHPPILVGGNGDRTLQRVIDYGDEWMPIPQRGVDLPARIGELQSMAKDAGRGRIPVSLFGVPPAASLVERYRELEAGGVHRMLFWLPPAPSEAVLPVLKQCAEVAKG
jgi:probable F420-dependent oxidoreductase